MKTLTELVNERLSAPLEPRLANIEWRLRRMDRQDRLNDCAAKARCLDYDLDATPVAGCE